MKSCSTILVAVIALVSAAPEPDEHIFRGVWTIDNFYEHELLVDKTPKAAPPMMEEKMDEPVVEPMTAEVVASNLERDTMAIQEMAKKFTQNLIDIANSLSDSIDTTKSVDGGLNLQTILAQLPTPMLDKIEIAPLKPVYEVQPIKAPTFALPESLSATISEIFKPKDTNAAEAPHMMRMARPFKFSG